MATTVYDTFDLKLQDGTEVTLRPLNIKQLRKFMVIVEKLGSAENEDANLEILLDACALALQKQAPNVANDRDALEEALDMPTIWKIIEVAGGIKMGDPNLGAAGAAGLI